MTPCRARGEAGVRTTEILPPVMSDNTIPELPSKKVPYGTSAVLWRSGIPDANPLAYSPPRQVRAQSVQGHSRLYDLRQGLDGLAVAPQRRGGDQAHQIRVSPLHYPSPTRILHVASSRIDPGGVSL